MSTGVLRAQGDSAERRCRAAHPRVSLCGSAEAAAAAAPTASGGARWPACACCAKGGAYTARGRGRFHSRTA